MWHMRRNMPLIRDHGLLQLQKELFGMRYLTVLDDLWDTATWDELTRPFPEFQKRSRIILTSRKKKVTLQGKCHSDPLYLRLLTLGERVFRGEHCPDELLDVREKQHKNVMGFLWSLI
ncbi:hypothetical protein RND71_008172 [Anisodus tanguticus]|uniref:NB-ARC domain-containing protein n=1 Tax=Anisodus tanguticus TaxID=243964 RepID=A0AAE1VJQ8_9SOLA|nr:hypothetical protein RND71_008172 [Anisodus tanguticus]